jgi:hypothetical protein
VLIVAVAVVAGAVAAQASAAQPAKAKLKHGVLAVKGTKASDEIALRLAAGDPNVLQVDVGDDRFVWDPGDGSDIVEGEHGTDTMLFNGAAGAEQVDLSANGNRLKFFRTQGTVTMDTAGVEVVDFNALGGADLVTVNDLSGTDVSSVNVDLAGASGATPATASPTASSSTPPAATTRSQSTAMPAA